jgi:hypothetical protein
MGLCLVRDTRSEHGRTKHRRGHMRSAGRQYNASSRPIFLHSMGLGHNINCTIKFTASVMPGINANISIITKSIHKD